MPSSRLSAQRGLNRTEYKPHEMLWSWFAQWHHLPSFFFFFVFPSPKACLLVAFKIMNQSKFFWEEHTLHVFCLCFLVLFKSLPPLQCVVVNMCVYVHNYVVYERVCTCVFAILFFNNLLFPLLHLLSFSPLTLDRFDVVHRYAVFLFHFVFVRAKSQYFFAHRVSNKILN